MWGKSHIGALMADNKISTAKLDKAKKLYMQYESITGVAKAIGVARSSVSYHVKKDDGWEFERNLLRAELLNKVSASRSADFASMTSSTINVLKRALQTLEKREEPPSVSEAKGAASILDILDKIDRLDQGSPTDIIQSEKIVTVSELQKKIKLDPFNTVEEIEYEEVPES